MVYQEIEMRWGVNVDLYATHERFTLFISLPPKKLFPLHRS